MNDLLSDASPAYSVWRSGVVHRMNHILRAGPGIEVAWI